MAYTALKPSVTTEANCVFTKVIIIYYYCVYEHTHTRHGACVGLGGQLCDIGSLRAPSHEFQEWNTAFPAWVTRAFTY